ncbi:MAG: 23S rRNA (uracil(1939)-C(5))-methyltransferase RlmD [Spirochaetaceae bacterium]|nr:MAG: 23S rRNA (uracil(1939)-C(5))-methyltransferase RlmD [Spirochaetaceae bacterium]
MPRMEKNLKDLEIVDLEYTGHGVAKPENGPVIFVEDVLPGEVVHARVHKKKKRFAFAHPVEFVRRSPERVEPFCRHFEHCGGCKWQFLEYAEQCRYKKHFVEQIFDRLAAVPRPEIPDVLPSRSDRFYRNRLDFSFSNRRWLTPAEIESDDVFSARDALGFHVKGSFDKVLQISECFLLDQLSDRIRNTVCTYARERGDLFYDPVENAGELRSLIIRTSRNGGVMVILVLGTERDDLAGPYESLFREQFPEITSFYVGVNTSKNDTLQNARLTLRYGESDIVETLLGIDFSIRPQSFFQTNPDQAERLYELVREWAGLDGSQVVYDLYCGAGSIALLVAAAASHVYGVENVPEAIDAARTNQEANGVDNCTFVCGTVEDVLSTTYPGDFQRPDLVILDPPRAGLHPAVVKTLLREKPPRIIYVSCKPSTQARDVAMLSEAYDLVRIQPVDMFPQTYHIENVVELVRKNE